MSRIVNPTVLSRRLSDALQALPHHLNIGFANARIQGNTLNKSEPSRAQYPQEGLAR